MKFYRIAQNTIFDPQNGIGAVPFNASVEYRGFVKPMTPAEFRELVPQGYSDQESSLHLIDALKDGKQFGNPFLIVKWKNGKWKVTDHEGRSRSDAVAAVYGQIDMPVHIFPIGLRARDLTEDMTSAEFIPQ